MWGETLRSAHWCCIYWKSSSVFQILPWPKDFLGCRGFVGAPRMLALYISANHCIMHNALICTHHINILQYVLVLSCREVGGDQQSRQYFTVCILYECVIIFPHSNTAAPVDKHTLSLGAHSLKAMWLWGNIFALFSIDFCRNSLNKSLSFTKEMEKEEPHYLKKTAL